MEDDCILSLVFASSDVFKKKKEDLNHNVGQLLVRKRKVADIQTLEMKLWILSHQHL